MIEDDIIAIKNVAENELHELLDRMQMDTDQQTDNSDTDLSDDSTLKSSVDSFNTDSGPISPQSPSTDSQSEEGEATDVSYGK